MKGEENIELELSINELVDVSMGINYAQGFDLNVDMHIVDVNDVAPPTVKTLNPKCQASLLSNFFFLFFLAQIDNSIARVVV